MRIELTELKRYELEKDNVVSVLLAAARSGNSLTAESLATTLNINIATVNKLIAALRNDIIIK